jgi:gluconokinase
MVILIMGVAGSGKTTVGIRLASSLGWEFADADDFHSPDNVAKMAAGIPLTDEDRGPWLRDLQALVRQFAVSGRNLVLACSALRASYRDLLCSANSQTAIVYLKTDPPLILERLTERQGHYMPASLIESQFKDLEEPNAAITIPADRRPDQIVDAIRASLFCRTPSPAKREKLYGQGRKGRGQTPHRGGRAGREGK